MEDVKIYKKNNRTVVEYYEEDRGVDELVSKMGYFDIEINQQDERVNIIDRLKPSIVICRKYENLFDEQGVLIGTTFAELNDYLSLNTGFNTGSGGSEPVDPINYKATNYTDLLTIATDPELNQLAHVRESEGTKWRSYLFGGTYYPSGVYYYNGVDWISDRGEISKQLYENTLNNRIRVDQSNYTTTLGGTIDPAKEYFIDGVIDLGTTQIEVPIGGINIKGYDFVISGLMSSEDNYTMFTSPVSGSGGVFISGVLIQVNGLNSQVYGLVDATGFNAVETEVINYNNCTSLGELNGYRQGLEVNSGRFGGSPELCLSGTWLGGFRVSTSIVRNLDNAWTGSLFKAGVGFMMNSRFLTDMNCDLGTLCSLLDFSDANFANPSTLELRDVIMTRNGLVVPNDTNITPNILASNLVCSWKGNNGMPNTFVGGISTCTTEIQTGVTGGLPFVLLGTFTNTDMQHFDSPANGQLRHLGSNPREYTANFDFVLDGGANQEYRLDLVKNDGSPSIVFSQTRVINNLQGGRDVAYYTGLANVILNKDDYVFWQVTNITNNANCTLELGSSWSVEER